MYLHRLTPPTAVSGFGDCLLVPAAAGGGASPPSQLFRRAGLHMALPTNGRPAPVTRSRWALKLPPGLKHLSVPNLYKTMAREAPEWHVRLSMLLEMILSLV